MEAKKLLSTDARELSRRLKEDVLLPMKQRFIGKEAIIDLFGVCLVAGENLFLLGPPGTAKSALVRDLNRRIGGKSFEYLLTRFTEPSELFGPFDIRKLKEGELETNTDGMLPEASLVFLDELLNANSAILNTLLSVLHERVLRRGKEVMKLPLLCAVGASNHLPEEDALQALFDRFLLRVRCDYVDDSRLLEVLQAGWELESGDDQSSPSLGIDELISLRDQVSRVDLSQIREDLVTLVKRIRLTGLNLSDRRAVKAQRIIAASAVLSGRLYANHSDFWVLRHVWDLEEQIGILETVVDEVIKKGHDNELIHPASQAELTPDPEALAKLIEEIEDESDSDDPAQHAISRDRLSVASSRVGWVTNDVAREQLQEATEKLWQKLGTKP